MGSTSAGRYIRQLDGLRFYAIAGVFISHFVRFADPVAARFPWGRGVNLFFVLSGFLITLILLKAREKEDFTVWRAFGRFFLRRSLRIFPIYYLTLFFLWAIAFQNYREALPWTLTYTTNIYLALGKPYIGSFNHLWSLAVEEQFYLFWPFLVFCLPRKWLHAMFYAAIAVSLGFKMVFYLAAGGSSDALNTLTISCMDAFAMGGLIAYWTLYCPGRIAYFAERKWIAVIAMLLYVFLFIYPPYQLPRFASATMNNAAFAAMCFFILIPATKDAYRGPGRFLLANPVAVHLGRISYGLYLYHLFMPDLYPYMVEHDWIPDLDGLWPRYITYMLMTVVLAELSWWIVERPLNRLKDRFGRKKMVKMHY